MPPEVAKKIVIGYTNESWVNAPSARPLLVNHPLCSDKTVYPMTFETMTIQWDSLLNVVTIFGPRTVSFWCGTSIGFKLKANTAQDVEDLVDAFISLGAKVGVN